MKNNTGIEAFGYLKKVNAKNLFTFIENEHPQTIALIMCFLDEDKQSELIELFEEDVSTEIIVRIFRMENVSPSVILRVSNVLEERMQKYFSSYSIDGKKISSNILKNTYLNENILDNISEIDVQMSNILKGKILK